MRDHEENMLEVTVGMDVDILGLKEGHNDI